VTPDLNMKTFSTGNKGFSIKGTVKDTYSEVLFDVAFEEFGYAAVYIDENFEVIEARGDIRKFMVLPDKKFDLHILKMLPGNLSISLGAGLHKAAKKKERVAIKGAKIIDKNKIRY